MRGMLTSTGKPKSVQVECAPDDGEDIARVMAECGYRLVQRHATMAGNKQLARVSGGVGGGDADEQAAMLRIAHNAVFEPLG
jgi:hypothetical protein